MNATSVYLPPVEGMGLFEYAWRYLLFNFSEETIAGPLSVVYHLVWYYLICLPGFLFQFMPFMQKYKLQKKKSETATEQWRCLKLLLANQLCLQVPLTMSMIYYLRWFDIPFSYESIPAWYTFIPRLLGALVIEDAWHYWGHRWLHTPTLYAKVHKIHHSYPAPFAAVAEYAHPVETMLLGFGFFLPIFLLCNHFLFVWLWLIVRLLETCDVHSGYSFSWSPLQFLPFYGGSETHDAHHEFTMYNFAPTFTFWDKICGTDMKPDELKTRKAKSK
eukprot:GILJ01007860.1.p1 GENE.GILJ01007860.1~~GILJ01007860.1.p1  ORF type:complete len:274 (+),score=19.41 GILJ01007860.1:124-945(+)